MKVTCSDCGNSWEIADGDMPEGGADFETACPSCGTSVAVKQEGATSDEKSKVQWFVAVGRDRKGPFDYEKVSEMIASGEVAANGFVWRQGFDNWKKAADVPEFSAAFGGGQGGDAGMVWQRRETSVLFSLDDYKQRKATRSQGAVKDADVVDVRRLDEEPAAQSSSSGGGMITFDENEVQRVADALARKKKTKRGLAGLSIAIIIIVVIGASGFVAWQIAKNSNILSGPKASGTDQAVIRPDQPAQGADQKQPAQNPAQEVPSATEKAPAAENAPATGAAAAEGKVADESGTVRKTEPVVKKTTTETKDAAVKTVETTTKPATTTKPTTEVKADPVGAGNDADSLLAQLSAGKKQDTAKKDDGGGSAGASNLPERLAVSQVMKGFNAKKGSMDECVRSSGEAVPFSAKANVEIEGSGRVASVKMTGGGAARGCLEGVLRSVTFDKFSGPNMKVPYTISVR